MREQLIQSYIQKGKKYTYDHKGYPLLVREVKDFTSIQDGIVGKVKKRPLKKQI